jgi:hypothetical protein
MKRDPIVSPGVSRVEDRYDRRVDAIATQITARPSFLTIVRAVGTLVFFDLLRAYEVSRLRRTSHTQLWD